MLSSIVFLTVCLALVKPREHFARLVDYRLGGGFGDRFLFYIGMRTLCAYTGAYVPHDFFFVDGGWGRYDERLMAITESTGSKQITYTIEGGLDPVSICPFYQLSYVKQLISKDVSIEDIANTWRNELKSIKPSDVIRSLIPQDIHTYIGIHLRKSDKVVDHESPFAIHKDDYPRYISSLKAYIKDQILLNGERRFFIASEEEGAKMEMIAFMRSVASDIEAKDTTMYQESLRPYQNGLALLDFFTLSRCKCILMGTKYSTFALSASMLGGIPLISMFPCSKTGFLPLWRHVVDIRFVVNDCETDLAITEKYRDILSAYRISWGPS